MSSVMQYTHFVRSVYNLERLEKIKYYFGNVFSNVVRNIYKIRNLSIS